MLPNFLYIGPDKAASSWLFTVFKKHDDIYVTPAKDLYYFSERTGSDECYYAKGIEWYKSKFNPVNREKIICEISHDYLYSEVAARRIKNDLRNVKLMVNLRDPVERTYSAYLHMKKTGYFTGSFEDALRKYPFLVDNSKYAKHLKNYYKYFDKNSIYIGLYDDLVTNPQLYLDRLCEFLSIDSLRLNADISKPVLVAGEARLVILAKYARVSANLLRRVGFAGILGKLKSNEFVRYLLYKPYIKKPEISEKTKAELKDTFYADVCELTSLVNKNFLNMWGY